MARLNSNSSSLTCTQCLRHTEPRAAFPLQEEFVAIISRPVRPTPYLIDLASTFLSAFTVPYYALLSLNQVCTLRAYAEPNIRTCM